MARSSKYVEKKDPALRLPRQAEHYSQIVGHFLAVKTIQRDRGRDGSALSAPEEISPRIARPRERYRGRRRRASNASGPVKSHKRLPPLPNPSPERSAVHAGGEIARHAAGARGAEDAARDRARLPAAARRPARQARHRLRAAEARDLRPRLLLARPRLRARRAHAQGQRRLLAGQDRAQPRARRANADGARGPRLARAGDLRMRAQRPPALGARLGAALACPAAWKRPSRLRRRAATQIASLAPRSDAATHVEVSAPVTTGRPIADADRLTIAPRAKTPEKDAPLRDDIRLLGRMLGDTVREQEGEEIYEFVERIRQASIRFHRDNETGARRELAAILDSLDNDQTLASCARSAISRISPTSPRTSTTSAATAPMCVEARRRAPARSPTPSTRADEAGFDAAALRDFFDRALVSPVLTAHPTEVRRKSTLTRELEIAALLDARERAGRRRGRARAQRGAAAPRRPHALAHQHAAPDAARGDRRSRQRPRLLRLHVLSRAAAPLRGDRGRARAPATRRRGQARRLVPARRLVDRRRPRRQSLRHRRSAERGDADAERARARPLSRRAARARRRTVDERQADAR